MILLQNIQYYTTDEIAKKLNYNIDSIRRIIRQKKLKAVKIGKTYYVKVKDFNEYINQNTTF